jgi:hypothetical protein
MFAYSGVCFSTAQDVALSYTCHNSKDPLFLSSVLLCNRRTNCAHEDFIQTPYRKSHTAFADTVRWCYKLL